MLNRKRKNKNIYDLLNDKKCRLGDLFLKFGAELIMNGDWFDCNRCGVIVNANKTKSSKTQYGAVCLHCYEKLKNESNNSSNTKTTPSVPDTSE